MNKLKNRSVSEIGEFKLLDYFCKRLKKRDKKVEVGIGDDAFVGKIAKGRLVVGTVDMLVEGTHFRRDWATPAQIGYKAITVNLSDLAAMGKAKPLYALIGLGVPKNLKTAFINDLYTGMKAAGDKYGLNLIGGDTIQVKKDIVISITLFGEIEKKYIVKRSCAKPGDFIVTTGTLGDSAGGLFLLKKGSKINKKYEKSLVKKHILPEPLFITAGQLAETGKISSMIDSSDGLAASVRFLAQASGIGAEIYVEQIPLSKNLVKLASDNRSFDPFEYGLTGGEEYELVFTVAPVDYESIHKRIPQTTIVGRMGSNKNVRCTFNGTVYKSASNGYQHFK